MKVLVIDEDKFVRNIIESELHQENIMVELAKDGAEGLNKAKEIIPNLIITELILTKINGFELIKEIRSDEKLKEIPIIVCSALSQESDKNEAIAVGADKFFSKEDYSIKQIIKEVLEVLISK